VKQLDLFLISAAWIGAGAIWFMVLLKKKPTRQNRRIAFGFLIISCLQLVNAGIVILRGGAK